MTICMQASWLKGSKAAVLGGTDIKLPPLNAPDAVGEPGAFWVRFIGDPKEWPGENCLALLPCQTWMNK